MSFGSLAFFVVGALLAACAATPPQPPVSATGPSAAKPGAVVPSDSTLDEMTAEIPSRIVGDTVVVRLSEALRARVAQRIEKVEGRVPARKAPVPDAATMQATIREVLPRGVYVIEAAEPVKVGDKTSTMILEGKIRDRDIDSGNAVSSDAILNLTLKVNSLAPRLWRSGSPPTSLLF